MRTTCSRKTAQPSGTRRSENNPNSADNTRNGTNVSEAFDNTPKLSTQSFIMPGSQPVHKTPLIKDLIEQPIVRDIVSNLPQPNPTDMQPMVSEEKANSILVESDQTPEENAVAAIEVPQSSIDITNREKSETIAATDSNNFEARWTQLFQDLFEKVPMIYHPLKDHIPTLENKVIQVEVLNTFQQEQYEMHKRAILEYWRTHYDDCVDDVKITLNEHLEVKKIIFTAEDKLKNLQEQNPQITNFMNILNFKIKD